MEKVHSKGFTLIELLITIAVIGIISTIGIVVVTNTTKKAKEVSYNASYNLLERASKLYATELKNQNKYWFQDDSDPNVEYSCISMLMLINKGYFKESDIEALKPDITKDTLIRVSRDITTKVLSAKIILDDDSCIEGFQPNVTFTPSGDVKNNWYRNLNVEIAVSGSNIDYYEYYIKNNGSKLSSKTQTGATNVNVPITINSNKLNVCVNVYSLKETTSKEICSNNYQFDNEPPSAPNISFSSNYNVNFSGSTDNLSKNITYHYSKNNKDFSSGSSLIRQTSDTQIYAYAEDYAGNISSVSQKKLNIESSTGGTVSHTETNKYYCSYTKKYYDTYSEANNACYVVTEKTVTKTATGKYKCSLYPNKTYTTKNLAENDCTTEDTNAKIHNYKCPNGTTQNTKNCIIKKTNVTETFDISCDKSNPGYIWLGIGWPAGCPGVGYYQYLNGSALKDDEVSCGSSTVGVAHIVRSGFQPYCNDGEGDCNYFCYTDSVTICDSSSSCKNIQYNTNCGLRGTSLGKREVCDAKICSMVGLTNISLNDSTTCPSGYTANYTGLNQDSSTCPQSNTACQLNVTDGQFRGPTGCTGNFCSDFSLPWLTHKTPIQDQFNKYKYDSSTCTNNYSSVSCTATATTQYKCSDGTISSNCKVKGEVASEYSYSCPSGYTCSGDNCDENSTCSKVVNNTVPVLHKQVNYYCSLDTTKAYQTQSEALEACMSNCEVGFNYYDNYCYKLTN